MRRMQSGGWPYSKSWQRLLEKHRLFVQLSFVRRSCVRACVAIVIVDRHVERILKKATLQLMHAVQQCTCMCEAVLGEMLQPGTCLNCRSSKKTYVLGGALVMYSPS